MTFREMVELSLDVMLGRNLTARAQQNDDGTFAAIIQLRGTASQEVTTWKSNRTFPTYQDALADAYKKITSFGVEWQR